MKKFIAIMMITAAIVNAFAIATKAEDHFSHKKYIENIRDDFSDPRWETLEGHTVDESREADCKADYKDQTLFLPGSCMKRVDIDPAGFYDFTGQVSFFLPDQQHQEEQSASFALFSQPKNSAVPASVRHTYLMVIFNTPEQKGGMCKIGLYPDPMVSKKLEPGKWHTIKVESKKSETRMKVWPREAKEPAEWDVETPLPEYMTKIEGVGMRTSGPAVQYDDFVFTAKKYHPLTFEKNGMQIAYFPSGKITSLKLPFSEERLQFRTGAKKSGPAWFMEGKKVELAQKSPDELIFAGKQNNVLYSIEYKKEGDRFAIAASLKNEGQDVFQPDAARLMLGLNTAMYKYPDWNYKFFPTLIRGEKTHLWGYFMSPKGRILTIASPDPIASWNYEYRYLRHKISTISLDMLHKLPLPERHPQNLTQLLPGEEKTWTIYLQEVGNLEKVKPIISKSIDAPMFDMDRYTVAEGESSEITIHSDRKISLSVIDPQGKTKKLKTGWRWGNKYKLTFTPESGVGIYTFKAENKKGKITEAKLYLRHPWSWYLKQARKEAVRCPQKAAGCCENWLGHFSTMLAKRYFPDEKLDAEAETNFRTILPLMFDVETGAQLALPNRIQNSYYMISLLTDSYQATGNIKDLELAAKIANQLIKKHQSPDGAFRNKGTHYTCVAYGAKSMLELVAAEKDLAKTSNLWKDRYNRHFESAKAAMHQLEEALENVETEGPMTYEDGMISCSATQLAMWGLWAKDEQERAAFTKAAEFMFNGHRCLDQMIVPDTRYHEGTLRFWEVQYDVLIPESMMNSPHGWTAWRIPGLYYMYQLTGDETWLRRAMNSLGTCVQLIDGQSGILRHSFAQDPYVEAHIFKASSDPDKTGEYVLEVVGEQYIEMISDFHQPKDFNVLLSWYSTKDGSSCDNDVHEVFKALGEVALTAAYVVERTDGSLSTYNCKAKKKKGVIEIIPAEDIVSRIHLNLKNEHNVKATFGTGETVSGSYSGIQWIGPGGVPEDLRAGI